MSDDGVETVFPMKTLISFKTEGEVMDVQAKVSISFQNFQRNQTQILKNSLEEHDDCGDQLKVTDSKFYEHNGLSFLTISFKFEQRACAFGGSTRLFEQSGKIKVKLTPEIQNASLLIRSEVVDVEADGLLGSLLDNDSFKKEVIELIGLDDRFEAELPEELASLNPDFQSFNFSTLEQVIYLSAQANMQLSGSQLALLLTLGKDD